MVKADLYIEEIVINYYSSIKYIDYKDYRLLLFKVLLYNGY